MTASGGNQESGMALAVFLSLPAIANFPMKWLLENTHPPNSLWYFADRLQYMFVVVPLCLVALLVMWRSFHPRTPLQRAVLYSLLLLNIVVVVSSLGFIG